MKYWCQYETTRFRKTLDEIFSTKPIYSELTQVVILYTALPLYFSGVLAPLPTYVQDADIRLLCVALERNDSLTSIDLRMNDVSADLEDLQKIEVPHMCSCGITAKLR